MREPRFWWRPGSTGGSLLAPLGAVYGAVAGRRLRRAGARVGVPVVCIGNPTVGGAGKTPTAIAVARMLQVQGERPVFLSRGYGGTLAGPVQVDPGGHPAAEVGDEPILLARSAATTVAHDRVAGAAAAVAAGGSIIVMDDGFQNPSLAKDFSVLVLDARRGVGNGRVIPAGPLRAPLGVQLARAQALILVGGEPTDDIRREARVHGIPVFAARLVPEPEFVANLGRGRVLAFAGIGDPEKFFSTLRETSATVVATRSFDDHYRYSAADAQSLIEQANRSGSLLVTTEKDLARMQGDAAVAPLATVSLALPVTLQFDDATGFGTLLLERIAQARASIAQQH